VFKNAADHLFVEWDRKPIAFVAWGNVGDARAVEQLRSVAIEFGMAPIHPAVHTRDPPPRRDPVALTYAALGGSEAQWAAVAPR
jgi:NAD(P)H-dependent FMN reductase